MRFLPSILLIALCFSSSGVALAITGSGSNCPSLSNQRNKQLPAVQPMNQPTYLCNNAQYATDPPKLGDLSSQGQMLNAQVCNTNCNYRALFPDDPDSPLIPTQCGRGQNVDPPYAINGNAASQSANTGPPAPYMGTGGNCMPLMIPQAPINLEDQKPPTVKQSKPSASPAPSPPPGS